MNTCGACGAYLYFFAHIPSDGNKYSEAPQAPHRVLNDYEDSPKRLSLPLKNARATSIHVKNGINCNSECNLAGLSESSCDKTPVFYGVSRRRFDLAHRFNKPIGGAT